MKPVKWKNLQSLSIAFILIAAGSIMFSVPYFRTASAANQTSPAQPQKSRAEVAEASKILAEEGAAIEKRARQLTAREAAVSAKEEELKKISAELDTKIRQLNELKKSFEDANKKRKAEIASKQERYKKMIKVYKGLKPADAGRLIDKLEDDLAIEMLNQMDQKMVVKLIPYLNQPRVIKWTKLNLKGAENR